MSNSTANYRNLAVLHNWLLDNRERINSQYDSASWESTHEGAPRSVFGWAKYEGPGVIAVSEADYTGMVYRGEKVYAYPRYMMRVFGLDMGMAEYSWIDSCRWRARDNTLDGAIARIRFVIDNALDLPSLGELVDVLFGKTPIPYDVLENRPYDLNKPI